jgi:hypothetical protein
MNFGMTEEQDLLRSEVRKFLDEQSPMEEVRGAADTPEGFSRALWKQLSELGWVGLVTPEEYGGAGLGWDDLVVLLEETGRTLFPSPLLSCVMAGAAILDAGSEEQRRAWLPALADGSCIGTVAVLEEGDSLLPRDLRLRGEPDGDAVVLHGEKHFVAEAGEADLFVVAFRSGDADEALSLAVVEAHAEGVRSETGRSLDPTKRSGTLHLDGVRVGPDAILGSLGEAGPALALLLDRGAIATSAEMLGAAEGLHAMTVQYAKDRTQFGSPIGRYQGVKHPLAEGYVDLECMKSLLYYAAWALEASPEEVPLAASQAKAFASEAFSQMGITGIQLHGAIGYTQDSDVHLYLRRSKWARPAFGDEAYHYDRVATLGGI